MESAFAAVVAALGALVLTFVGLRPQAVTGHPRVVLAVLAGVTFVALVPLVQLEPLGLGLRIDPSTEPLLPQNDPSRAAYLDAVRDFGEDEVYVIALESDDAFGPAALESLKRVTDELARWPSVRRVQSLTDVVAFRWDPEYEWVEVRDFIEELPSDDAERARIRQEALDDPLYRRTLISDDGRTAAINVTFREITDQEFIDGRIDEQIVALLEAEVADGVRFHIAGRPHIKTRVYHMMIGDLRIFIPVALLVMVLGLAILFGHRRGVLLPVGTVVAATIWTFGAMAFLDRPLTLLTTLLAPMLAAIGSVYGIHALTRYEEEAETAPDPHTAAERSIEHLRLPVIVAGLTTMIGFGALLVTDVPAVFDVGSFAVLGVLAITVVSLTGIPAALALLPLRPAGSGARLAARIATFLDQRLAALAAFSARHATAALVVFAIAFVVSLVAIPRIVIDTDYLSFFSESDPIRIEFEAVNRLLSGTVPIYVSLTGDESGAFREPAALHAIERIQQGAEASPAVSRTISAADTVKVMNRAMWKDDPEKAFVPNERGGVAELLFLAPKGHLDRFANVDHSRSNVLVRTGALGTAAVRSVTEHLQRVVDDAGLPEGIRADVTGNALMLARSADGIAEGQPRTIGIAAIAILVLIGVAFRNPRLAVVAMVPNLVPVVLYFGWLGLGAAPLSLATSLIGSIALGIAIDDTVHFLVRYGQERENGATPEEAAAICGRRIGRAIAITSMMLMAGFLVVGLSSFTPIIQFGVLAAATMGACLVTDLVLLPALLVRTRA